MAQKINWYIHNNGGGYDTLKNGEYELVSSIFNNDSQELNHLTSWLREKQFRKKKLPGKNRPTCVATLKELSDAIDYMRSLFPKKQTKRYKLLLKCVEFYNSKSKIPYEW